MRGRNLRADARLALRHDRIRKANNVNAFFQHGLGKSSRQRGIAEHHRADRMCAGQNIKTQLGHAFAEILGIRLQLVPQGGGLGQHFQNFQRRARDRRGERVGKQIGPGTLTQIFDDVTTTAGIAATRTTKRLAQGAGQDVHAPQHTIIFVGATTRFTHETNRMGIIHHHQRAILIGQITEGGQIGDVAIHRKHPIGGDHFKTTAGGFFQLCFQVGHVVVFVAVPLRFAQPDAINDTRMIQLIGNNRIGLAQQGLEQSAIGIEAGGIKNGVLGAEKLA